MKQQIDQIAMWVSFVLLLLLFKPESTSSKAFIREIPFVPKSTTELVLFIPSHEKKYHKSSWL